MHSFLTYFYNGVVPNAFLDRAWGAAWGMLKGQGKSDDGMNFILHTDDYDHPIDQTVRKGEYWGWKGNRGPRMFGY